MPKTRQLLFIFADDNSHLQKTMPIAKYYGNLGFETHYSGPKLLIKYTLPNGFSLYPLVTKPLFLSKSKWFKTGVCLEEIEQQYDQRLHELNTMIEKINPEIIFFDSFCFSDIVLVKALKSKARLVLLQTKLPMHFNWFIPPLYSSKLPNAGAFFEWLSFFGTNLKKDFYRKYFTKRISKIIFLEKVIKKHELNLKFFTNKVFHPSFYEVEEWFLAPDYFDYKQQKLFAWQRYAGFLIDMHRAEFVSNEVRTFLENTNNSHSLIYFSLGVSYFAHLENPSQVFAHFVEIISKLSAQHSNFRFIAVVPKLYQPSTKNEAILWLEKAPQLTILKKANLFLTHGGMNSLLEAAYLAVPVVVFPLNDVWDQNGNAARISYHGTGKLADLKISYEKLQRLIIDILQNEEIRENCVKMSQRMKTNNLNIN